MPGMFQAPSGQLGRISNSQPYFSSNIGMNAGVGPMGNTVSAWVAAVVANGGTVSDQIKSAVSAFYNSLQAANQWKNIIRLNLFTGDQLAAALVPLKVGSGGAVDTNFNFVAGDYGVTTGLTGNGATKKLDTGVPILSLDKTNFGMGTWTRTNTSEAARRADIGSSYIATGSTDRFYNHTCAGVGVGEAGMGSISTQFNGWSVATGLLAQETTGTTTQNVWKNGTLVLSNGIWNNDGFQAGTVTVFNGGGNFPSNHSLAGYYIGNNLDQVALSSAWATFNATLGR